MLWIGTAIFVLTYIAIALESKIKVDKTASALAGCSLMLLFILKPGIGGGHAKEDTNPAKDSQQVAHVAEIEPTATTEKNITANEAVASVTDESSHLSAWNKHTDFDVIFLLAGMMVIVNAMRESGIFQYVAIKCAKLGRGKPIPVLILLLFATAVLSALLDNVTTVLLISPITLLVASEMKINPVYFLLPEIMACNIGGTATLIGDPPNIIVGSRAGKIYGPGTFDFLSFIQVLSPIVIVVLIIFIAIVVLRIKGALHVTAEERARIMELDERASITDSALLIRGLIIMGFTLTGFLLHSTLHVEPGVIAMAGAALTMILAGHDVGEMLAKIEWETLFFFIGLFVVVKGASQCGLLGILGDNLAVAIGHPEAIIYIAPLVVLWLSGILAGIMNNVSFTLAALPIVESLAVTFFDVPPGGGMPPEAIPMFWALALGACLGGNLTPLGAAANLVVINIAGRSNHTISWSKYIKWGMPCALGSLILASGYITLYVYLTQSPAA